MKKDLDRQKGITLIALVITIIVLLILAGIAISMLSGENGILKKAAEAKTKTEQAQQEEKITLTDYDIEGQFRLKNSKYKCRYGYITGVTYGIDKIEDTVEDTVEDLNNVLDGSGYTVATYIKYDSTNKIFIDKDIEDSTMTLRTGMGIKKDGEIIARVIVFGDISGDGIITAADRTMGNRFLLESINLTDAQQQAMDVNHDGKINREDTNFVLEVISDPVKIDQNKYVTSFKDLIIRYLKQISKEYVENNLPETFKNQSTYKFEYDKDSDNYVLKGAKTDTNASSITSLIPGAEIKKGTTTVTDKIEDGCTIVIPIDIEGYEQIKFDIAL